MIDQLFTSKWLFWMAALFLFAAIGVGIVLSEGPYANIASIAGLAVSVLGFVVTIWTVLDARQQIKEASNRAQQAIAQAREDGRRAVQAIAAQLRAADTMVFLAAIEDLRQASHDRRWQRAVYRCQQCRPIAYRLARDDNLMREEASALRQGAADLDIIQLFIEKNRLADQPGFLQGGHVKSIDSLIGLLAQMQGRLHHEPLRSGSLKSNME